MSGFDAPFVAESTVKIAMELREIIPVPLNGTTLVIGEIKHILMNQLLVGKDGYVDHEKAGTITVVGLDSYFDTLALARLSYAKPNQGLTTVTRA